MIICRKCSRRYADGTAFCTCGAFLEFDGERVDDTADPTTASRPADAPRSVVADPSPTHSTGQDPGPPTEPAPWSGLPTGDASTEPATGSVGARHPDAPVDQPTTDPVPVSSTGRPTDITCRQCGTANPPELQFCRHCGRPTTATASMPTDDAGHRRPPWWKRLGRRLKPRGGGRGRMSPAGGARQVSRGGLSQRSLAFRGVGVLLVVGVLLAFLGPWRGPIISKGRELAGGSRYRVVDDVTVDTLPAAASITPAEFPLQPPDLAVDEFENTAWATRWADHDNLGFESLPAGEGCVDEVGTDSVLRFTFTDPVDLKRVRILGGRFAGDEARTTMSRPRIVELRTDETCTHLELSDDGELAIHDFDHDDVTEVELRILGRYADESTAPRVEVSAVAFDKKR